MGGVWFEFTNECVSELKSCFEMGPIIIYQGQELRSLNEQLIDQFGGLKMHIYADEHPPPHFHVKYGGEENSFSLIDGTPLYPDNGLKQYFRNINKWFSKNKNSLVSAWNQTRPLGCPVGPIA